MKRFSIPLIVVLLFGLCSTAMSPWPAPREPHADLVVDTTIDSNNSSYQACTSAPNDCSLRGAIIASNFTVGMDESIRVPAGIYTLTLTGTGDDNNMNGDLDISAPVTIEGAGTDATIIRAGTTYYTGIDRVMHIFSTTGTVKISDLTIKWGRITSINDNGAGIYHSSTGTVILERVAVIENNNLGGSTGGGIYTVGEITLLDSTVMFNNTLFYGGGIYGTLGAYITIDRSTIAYNSAGYGGGIFCSRGLLRNSTISGNTATGAGGGIYMNNYIYSLIIFQSTITGMLCRAGLPLDGRYMILEP